MLLNIWNYLWLEATFCLKYLVFVIHCSYWIALHSLRVWIWNENCGEEAYIFPHVRNCHKMIWGGKSHYKPVLSFGQIALILSAPPFFFTSLINQENALLQIHGSEVYSSLLLSMPKPLDLQGKGWHLGRFPRFTLFQQTVSNILAFYWNLSRLSFRYCLKVFSVLKRIPKMFLKGFPISWGNATQGDYYYY